MAGRPPLPAKVKKARGNAGKRPIKDNISPAIAGPEPPIWVAAYPAALAQWKALAPEMIRRGTLTLFVVNLIGRYCVLMAEWLENNAILRQVGAFQQTKNGLAKHPAWLVRADANKELLAIEAQAGLTPITLAKLYAPEGAGDAATARLEGKFFAPPQPPEDPENEE